MEKKKLPSEYYDSKEGLFVSKKIWGSFGRRSGFLIQFILDKYEQAIKENKLIKNYVFIPNEDIKENTGYNTNSSFYQNTIRAFGEFKKWNFLSVETFGAEDGHFYKIDLYILFKQVIPEFEKNYRQNIIESEK